MGEKEEPLSVPLLKSTVDVQISDTDGSGEEVVRSIPALTRDDGGNFLQVLTQINWGLRRKRKYRDTAGKVMEELRNFNFQNSLEDSYDLTFPVPESICQQVYEFLTKEDCNLRGPNAVLWATDFEKWFAKRNQSQE